jgi:hypothetical protein
MRSSDSLPVRTTFLHFVYPDVVPIFDKQVLKAVGIYNRNANRSRKRLLQYVPHAWKMLDLHSSQFNTFKRETAVRLIDMALWVTRDKASGAGTDKNVKTARRTPAQATKPSPDPSIRGPG